ncbi:MAG: hypothetical protein E7256_02885 [Lachnospiraceae bacterium]|nr:hypothetical protein [Lachnospiraceae bacterium]
MNKKKWILLAVCLCAGAAVIIGRTIRKNNDTIKTNNEMENVSTATSTDQESEGTESEQENAQGQKGESENGEDVKEADWDAFDLVLADIYNAMPGVSGCSLKSARAAGEILDWAKVNMSATSETKIKEKAQNWYNENKEELVEADSIMLAWESVYEDAKTILTDRDSILPLLDDAGYELQNDSYNMADIETIQNAFEQAFPEAPEGVNE